MQYTVEDLQRRLSEAYGEARKADRLRERVKELELDAVRMRTELEARYREIAGLVRMTEEARSSALVASVGQDKPRAGSRVAGVLQRWRRRHRLRRNTRRVEVSGLFDASWYLEKYPDVAAAGVDPLAHYMEFGAPEGREVGPAFDVKRYLTMHPAAVNANPLLDFLNRRDQQQNGGRKP